MSRGLPRWVDIVVATAVLVAGAPLWLVVAVAVRCSSPGPVFYRGRRVGMGGREFEILKFRSMRVNDRGARLTTAADDRITPVGRWLRATKLDEVPQLINVLRGEMALVGPRPEDPRYVATYTVEQRQVLTVRPGLTSPASIEYRFEEQALATAEDVESVYLGRVLPDKLRIDLAWLAERTAWGDVAVIARTLAAVVKRRADIV